MTGDTNRPSLHTRRGQKLCIVRRDGEYWLGGGGWCDDPSLAKVWPDNQVDGKVRVEIGMPCEILYVAPFVIEDVDPRLSIDTLPARTRR